MRFMHLRSATLLATLVLLLGGPPPADAATTVDVTYDLADSTLDIGLFSQLNRDFGGTMTVRYTGDGGLGIVSGPATILSLTFDAYLGFGYGYVASATMTGQLLAPVTGTLVGNNLSGLSGFNLAMAGTVHCKYTGPCTSYFGLVASIPFPISGSTVGDAQLGGPIGPYGGAQSTPHTLQGNIPAHLQIIAGTATVRRVNLVGRELLRTGGGQTKPIPEPGTLLLLGAGAVGLALVGRATRRSHGT